MQLSGFGSFQVYRLVTFHVFPCVDQGLKGAPVSMGAFYSVFSPRLTKLKTRAAQHVNMLEDTSLH